MNKKNVIHGKYYPHIDGIRTLAVLPVVFYHLWEVLCPGGFVGVDLFFVISGYLITGGILGSLEKNSFGIKDFYTKRIRRIIPAYLALIAFVLAVSAWIFPPDFMERTFSTATASAVFATNIFLYLKTGYFEADSGNNPLLHLWSLGIEEQFYIFIPLFLLLLYKINRKWIFPFILFSIAASLSISILCTATGRDNFNFYMLPTRAWELLAGSLLACLNKKPAVRGIPAGIQKHMGLLGAVICLGAFLLYTPSTPFPGLGAVPPVLGACLMIKWGNQGISGTILESKPFVGIGKISYSLYLWHWPLMVFWNYLFDNSRNLWGLSLVFALSLLMAWLSWRFVELPVRLSKEWNFKKAMIWGVGGCSALVALGAGLVLCDFPEKRTDRVLDVSNRESFWQEASKKASDLTTPLDLGSFEECGHKTRDKIVALGSTDSPRYALWGDSHAGSLCAGFDRVSAKTGINGIFINRRHYFCYQKMKAHSSFYPHNRESIENTLAFLSAHPEIKTVFLANRWATQVEESYNDKLNTYPMKYFSPEGTLLEAPSSQIVKEGLERLCRELKQRKKRVVLVSSIPEQEFSVVPRCYKNALFRLSPPGGVAYGAFSQRDRTSKDILEEMAQKGLAEILWVEDFFFPNKADCRISGKTGMPFYTDSNHLSEEGARALMKHLENEFKDKVQH